MLQRLVPSQSALCTLAASLLSGTRLHLDMGLVNLWNSLPEEVVEAGNVTKVRKGLERVMDGRSIKSH